MTRFLLVLGLLMASECETPPPSEGGDAGPPEIQGCTLTQGFWKNHEEVWRIEGLTIGGSYYSAGALDDLLETPTRGDASMILVHQLIAAILNAANGATSIAAIDAALSWMDVNRPGDGMLPYGIGSSTPAGQEAVMLSTVLDEYNNGRSDGGPRHCGSNTPTPPCVDGATLREGGESTGRPCEEPPPPDGCQTAEKDGAYTEDPCANDPL